VDLLWMDGKAVSATLRPDLAGEVRLRPPAGRKIHSVVGGNLRSHDDGTVTVMLEAKRSYRVLFAEDMNGYKKMG
jgi:hypothetical protein